jgi:hypothetical protein
LSAISTGQLWVTGLILAVIGIIIVAIPFASWTEGTVGDKLPDIVGYIIFAIGVIFIVIWAIKYGIAHVK